MKGFFSEKNINSSLSVGFNIHFNRYRLFLQIVFAFTLSTFVKYVMVLRKRFYSEHNIFSESQRQQTHHKNRQFHMTLEGLSSVCAKLEPASSKNNELLEINVLLKYTPHALYLFKFLHLCKVCMIYLEPVRELNNTQASSIVFNSNKYM